jgi:hypothetical protein
MLLRDHGTLIVGRSVASAFERIFHLGADLHHAGAYPHAQPDRLPGRAGWSTGTPRCSSTPTGRNCARPRWSGRRCCGKSTGLMPVTRIEIFGVLCRVVANNPCTANPNAAQFRAAFLFRASCRRPGITARAERQPMKEYRGLSRLHRIAFMLPLGVPGYARFFY